MGTLLGKNVSEGAYVGVDEDSAECSLNSTLSMDQISANRLK